MLHLYQSNRLESLAEMMAAIQTAQPLQQPLQSEEIVVQSQGMRRFINRFLAQRNGIAANFRFSLPAGLSWRLMREMIPGIPELSPFAPEVMRWRLLELFQSDTFQQQAGFQAAFAKLGSYLANGESAAYRLAGELADIFDQYLVYRPDWIDAWQAGKTVEGLGTEQIWQAQLWRFLDDGNRSAPHRVALWEQLLAALENPETPLPPRFFVFGISTMAPMYLELLTRLAHRSEVHIFALNPSAAYWGNVLEPAQILAAAGDLDLSAQGHPLLASLGKQGRDFFDALNEAGAHLDLDAFEREGNACSGSLLHTLQRQIQDQIMPADAAESWRQAQGLDNDDAVWHYLENERSIQIHCAHSPLRELQILKDRLLQLLADNPDWQPHDIAVLTPNIEPYAPFIESVFGVHSRQGQPLPYSLADVKLSRRQPLLDALEQTLVLLESRFESDRLLQLLESEPVLARFELTRDDVPLLREAAQEWNVRWGINGSQRAQFGGDNNLFTWQQGFDRLMLGWMLPENTAQPLWQNTSPWHSDPNLFDTFARFTVLFGVLSQTWQHWQQPAPVSEWIARIRRLCADLFAPAASDQYAQQQLEQTLTQWQAEADLAAFNAELSQETALVHVRRFLGSQSDAGFLRSGITFCSMVPMRSLPFKVICLLGLDDGKFPRDTKASSFDLIARHPRKGDRARRDDDRYLFLEAILSAREVLYLSYVGRSIRNNDLLAPSVMINELIDCIAALTGLNAADVLARWPLQHPLQAFSRQYFNQTPRLFGSRSDYAEALSEQTVPTEPFTGFQAAGLPENPSLFEVGQNEFLRFWRGPIKYWLRHTLQWQQPFNEYGTDSAEPVGRENRALLGAAYWNGVGSGIPAEQTGRILNAQSLLPTGELAALTRNSFSETAAQAAEILRSPPLPPQEGCLNLVLNDDAGQTSDCRLHYRLHHNRAVGQILYAADLQWSDRFSESDKISLLLRHMLYCAVQTDPLPTYFFGVNKILTLAAIPQAQAQTALAAWLAYMRLGVQQPLPFVSQINLPCALALFDKGKLDEPDDAARGKAYAAAAATFNQHRHYAELRTLYRADTDTTPLYDQPLFETMNETLFGPLRGYLELLA